MTEELEKLGSQKPTKEEVERSKTKLLAYREQQMKDANRIGVTLSEWAAQGDWRLFFLHRDRVAKVTAGDVARVAEKYLQRSNRTVGLYVPSAQVGADADSRNAERGSAAQGLQGRDRRRCR